MSGCISRFNLIDEPWIPVRFLDGTRAELGIRDALLRSTEIAVIEDQSPLVVAALHRFLLAVLYRALKGPTDIDQAKVLFRDGLPAEKIVGYLEKWRARFWLFDEKHPFAQNPNVPKAELEPWTKLTAEYNATSNKVLFDHTDAKSPGEKMPKDCVRWLLSTMSFSISGGRGYFPSPSANAVMCIPLGRNLQETLCYNLTNYPNRSVMEGDSALWEREPKALPLETPKRMALGFADLYTWQSRMVLLEETPSNAVSVTRFVAGQGFDTSGNSVDPMLAYKNDKNKGSLPVLFREDRGIWRDFDSLLPDGANLAPMTIEHAIRLAGGKLNSMPKSVLVLGLKYEPPSANVEFWRMEQFSLPEALASERYIRTEIHNLLNDANMAQKSLWSACSSFARALLSRGDRKVDEKAVTRFVKQMSAPSWYWSNLGSNFHEILGDYKVDGDPDDIRNRWLVFVREALSSAWNQHRSSVSTGDAWAIRALVKAEAPLRRKLKELDDEIMRLAPQEENA